MKKKNSWPHHPRVQSILHAFITPRTPRSVERELGIPKLRLKTLQNKRLLILLNPNATKGKLYTLTEKARRIIKAPISRKVFYWDIIGWLFASPKQRLIVINSMDAAKRTSEEIRMRASRYNPRFTRISMKKILNELVEKKLMETEMMGRKRYYWINEKGKEINRQLSILGQEKYL